MRILSADFFDECEPVHAGQFQVGQDQVNIGRKFQPVLGCAGCFDLETSGGEMEADDPA